VGWLAVLYGEVRPDLAITGGVHTAQDVLKSMMAGATRRPAASTEASGAGNSGKSPARCA
jgi:hypothetical protein